MNKIFNDLKEKHLNCIIFHGDTTALKLYYDKEKKLQVTKSDAIYAFEKSRVLIKVGEVSHVPVQCKTDGSLVILDTTGSVTSKVLAVSADPQ